MAVKACRVSVCDLKGVEHTIDVTANSLFEAVARGLHVFREADWVGEVGTGLTTVKVRGAAARS